jgi:hypothetical protein
MDLPALRQVLSPSFNRGKVDYNTGAADFTQHSSRSGKDFLTLPTKSLNKRINEYKTRFSMLMRAEFLPR